jgi:putative peptidoglycan lipid II flippase
VSTIKKFWYYISNKKLTIGNAALILAVTGLISNILGLYRERLIAGHFGASHLTDVFYASFRLPDMIFNLLILGALSSAFIPVFVEKITTGKKDEANDLANSFLNFIVLGAGLLAVIVFILAPKLVPFLLPGFFNRPEADFNIYQTTVNMTRVMMISPILFSISGVFGGILNSYKRFIAYSIAPLIYNISIIFSVLFLVDRFNPPIYGLTLGVVIGALLHALIQLPSVLATGYRWKPRLNLRDGQIARIFKLMAPRTLAIGANQINLFVDTIIASFFIGGITVLTFANDIQTAPTVIFGIAISTAIFPVLSEAAAKNDNKEFMKNFSWSARRILFFTIPATVGIIVLRAQIIRLIFGIGNFSWDNTYWTTKALLFFAIGLVAQGLIPLLLKAFYSLQDTRTPLYISFVVMIVNAVLSVTLPFVKPLGLGVAGVALAFSIAGIINAFLLFVALHDKIGALDRDHKIFDSTSRLILASVVMGLVAHYSLYLFDYFVKTHYVLGLLAQTMGSILLAAIVYFTLTWLLGCEETEFILEKIGNK